MIKLAKGGKILSYIFAFMIALSVVAAVFTGNGEKLSQSITDGVQDSAELLISVGSMMCLWCGIMEIAKQSGLMKKVADVLSVVLRKLYPDVDKNSKAFEYICMNVSANMLGLGNAATPMGLKAISELNANNKTDTATDSMITLVVMNTASVQLIPTTVCMLRASNSSKSPFDIIFCVWLSSAMALFVALFSSKILSKAGSRRCTL